LARVLSLCSFVLITVWVTPESQLAELALLGFSVLSQDFRGPQMGCSIGQRCWHHFPSISRLPQTLFLSDYRKSTRHRRRVTSGYIHNPVNLFPHERLAYLLKSAIDEPDTVVCSLELGRPPFAIGSTVIRRTHW